MCEISNLLCPVDGCSCRIFPDDLHDHLLHHQVNDRVDPQRVIAEMVARLVVALDNLEDMAHS